jgi:hypothetical protein
MTIAAQDVPHKRTAKLRGVGTTSVLVLTLCNWRLQAVSFPDYRQRGQSVGSSFGTRRLHPQQRRGIRASRRVPTDGDRTGRVLAGGIGRTLRRLLPIRW